MGVDPERDGRVRVPEPGRDDVNRDAGETWWRADALGRAAVRVVAEDGDHDIKGQYIPCAVTMQIDEGFLHEEGQEGQSVNHYPSRQIWLFRPVCARRCHDLSSFQRGFRIFRLVACPRCL